ncbi:hypothetical protein COT70_01745 [candidate division WWE3 bacterium CG09_land_8_20_14_0_10_47_33]|uniref:Aminoglycoside phosphotransferase domain-containing protein n=1 Tax=candidate division WWE3 bacterium CG_4_9_14_0_2_um_filter_48_10 TaxID=1975078 RepID=A0A2M8EJV3_UNCKA|nr:MAG: hypothetical protein COT70_01745 [candidate division WWE3 bacterium CG09_land_8_20_14_0_10_47_33]PIZ40883.1 MAG: hypothetical protein COY35_01470 [candidate division WWE3 bacterium CG_4_10_14_0_2_um_filter_47_8]PJC23026.1 MAG: hypothetical protein CO059_00790 [candidate division WWE3 bacterium CG_4_9_14_0_2_um_filter_48_10]PJE51697.1 MAG: hypothetical protein COV28_01905 [candidate division WWE3 bacterium CG10_big_fil_rev_8_21_14_0_10_48_23]
MNYQKLFQPVFDKLNFTLTKTFREGPRFYVVGGDYRPPRASPRLAAKRVTTGGGEKVIFKADLAAAAERLPKARLRLRREAVFLRHAKLRYAPKFYAKGIKEGFFWLLEEWVKGESQELGESPFLIKDSFFTEQNLKHSLEFLASLHRLSEKPQPQFEKYFSRYSLADYISLMQTDKAGVLGKILSAKADGFTRKRHRLFNQNQIVITHHEFYGPHIFVGKGEMQVIDWENVGWGNLAHDFVELWVRSFRNKDFQSEFFERFWASQKDKEVFDQLFRLEVILQGIGNLNHFKITKVPEEKKVAEEVSSFLLENIERALC